MIVFLDTPQNLEACATQLGGLEVEQLFTPLTRRAPQNPAAHFAIDNGAFAGFDRRRFENLLAIHQPRLPLCRFVAVPDVPYDARRTLEVFDHWHQDLCHWPLAFVAQDGQELLPIPWAKIQALFIGGSSNWKLSPHAIACIRAAKAIGKWVHVGRVNTPGRYEAFRDLGADSCDGTGIARYDHMREKIANAYHAPRLDFGTESELAKFEAARRPD
jgi:hypothetical protein